MLEHTLIGQILLNAVVDDVELDASVASSRQVRGEAVITVCWATEGVDEDLGLEVCRSVWRRL